MHATPHEPALAPDTAPLSQGQRGIWLADQVNAGGTEYLELVAVRLHGAVDARALDDALRSVVRRHEILRTTYALVDGEPMQRIGGHSDTPLRQADLSHLGPDERERRLGELIDTESATPFDLATGPVFRVTLVRLAAREHALVLAIHHIAFDGWSESVLFRDLWNAYEDRATDDTADAHPLPLQFADYALWQRSVLDSGALDAQERYWKERLAGAVPLEIPGDRPRPQVRGTTGAIHTFGIPAALAGHVRRVASERSATTYTVLLAAFNVLLARYAQTTDVVVGTGTAGRARPELEELIGYFVNTLPLRTQLCGDPSFGTAVERTRDAVLGALAHQDVPDARLVDLLGPDRDPSRNRLFQVVFIMQNAPHLPQPPGVTVEVIPPRTRPSRYDLHVEVTENADGSLTGRMTYATELYDAATIERLAHNYVRALHEGVTTPDTPAGQLEVLSDAERRTLLTEWNAAAPPDGRDLPFHRVVEEWSLATPQAVAVEYRDRTLGYAELVGWAGRFAAELRALGVTVETPVGVCLHRGPEYVAAVLGVLQAGGAFLPLDPAHPNERVHYTLEDARVPIVVTDSSLEDRLPPTTIRVLVDEVGDSDAEGVTANAPPVTVPCHADNLAYVIYTSGSTGHPKGVAVPHAGLLGVINQQREVFGVTGADRVLQFSSASFDASIYEMVWALGHGATLCLADAEDLRPGDALASFLAAAGITMAVIPPSCLAVTPVPDAPALRTVAVAGEACHPLVIDAWAPGRRMFNLYGPTEGTIIATAVRCGDGGDDPPSIGRPVSGVRVHLLDQDLRLAPIGTPGEICLGGGGVTRGYLHTPAVTATSFVPDPYAAEPGGRLYRTGDLARHLPDGRIEYLGRLDNQVKVHGFRIELGEIESTLALHPSVHTALVVSDGDEATERRLVAYVTGQRGSDPDARTLKEFLRRSLPEYMVPPHIVTLDAFPLAISGKIDVRALPSPRGGTDAGPSGRPPSTPVEERIAALWETALHLDTVGADDDFFDVGGDSIRAVSLVGALREEGFDVTVHALFRHRTVADMAAYATSLPRLTDAAARVRPFELVPVEDRERLPAGLTDAYPLARLQAGMLYEMLSGASGDNYHVLSSFHVRDSTPFSAQALRRAADALAERHEVLRTSFELTAYSQPLQLVHPQVTVPVEIVDLRGLDESHQDARMRSFISEQRGRAFDITQPPLLKIVAHPLSPDAWRISLIQSHAILDGWSEHVLLTELLRAYREAEQERDPEYRDPGLRFADFLPLEQAAVDSTDTRAFWAGRVRDTEPLALPEAWAGSPADAGHTHDVHVPADDLLVDLRAGASATGVSMKALFHAAFLTALSAVTGQASFCTGLLCNGRPEETGGDRVLGLFINTVPFVADVGPATWRDLVRDVFAEHLALEPHRRFPLTEAQHESGRRSRLVDVMFNFVDFHIVDTDLVDMDRTLEMGRSEIALDATVVDAGVRISGRSDRIDAARVRLLAGTLRRVLENIAEDIDGSARVDLLPEDELRRLTDEPAPVIRQELCVHELFERQAAATPDAVAIEDGAARMTYVELDERANRVARRLRDRGIDADDVVAVRLPQGVEAVVAILGVLKSGATYVPIEDGSPPERARTIVRDSSAAAMLTDTGDAAEPTTVLHVDAGREAAVPRAQGDVEELAYIIHTSGSTGRPKGVMVTHRGLANRVLDTITRHDVSFRDRVLHRTPLGFDAAAWEVFVPLLAGAVLVVAPRDADRDPARVVEGILAARVTVLQAVPPMLRALTARPEWENLDSLRLVYSAGEQLHADLARLVTDGGRRELWNVYGPTECSIGVTEHLYQPGDGSGPVPIGAPIDNVRLLVLGPDGRPVPDGVPGELHVAGACLARGYIGRPDLTAEAFVPCPYGPPGSRMYRTNDLVRRLPHGAVEFLGRHDEQVKVLGVRVEPQEVEGALGTHQDVLGAAVTAHAGEHGTRLVAHLRTRTGTVPDGLRKFLAERLPAPFIPAVFTPVADFPLTPNGKLDRAALALPEEASAATGAGTPPSTAAEHTVARVWSVLLGVPTVYADDDFFRLGGNSLMIARLAAQLRSATGSQVPLREFFAAPTVAEQAELLAAHRTGLPPIACLDDGTRPPMSFGQERMWFLDRLEPGSSEYVVPLALPLPPGARPDDVQEVLAALAARHDSLRTRYADDEGAPRPVLADLHTPGLQVITGDDGATAIREFVLGGFDLNVGPVWRAAFVEVTDGHAVLMLALHHIACDGRSVELLSRDITELLAARAADRAPELPDLPIRYGDFAAWQRQELAGDLLDSLLTYWRGRLEGAADLTLPTDRPRQAIRDPRGATSTFRVPPRLAKSVRELGRRHGATPFMTLLAGYYGLLSHYCGQDDIVVGAPVSGRNRPEADDVVGFFVNTLALRCDLSGGPTVGELLGRVRAATLTDFAHQELPFEQLVDAIGLERDLSRTPVFQVMFELHDTPPDIAEGTAERILSDWNVAKFDLTLSLTEADDASLHGTLEYATALFDPSTVERMAGHYLRLLERMTADDRVPVSELDFMSVEERQRALVEWNDTRRPPPLHEDHENADIAAAVEAQVRRTPDAVAVEYGASTLTYRELDARADALAHRLRSHGVADEVPVGILLERSAELVVALLAVLKAGGCFIPLEPDFPTLRVARILGAAGATICLVDPAAGNVPDGPVTSLEVGSEPAAPGRPGPPPRRTAADSLAAIYFTSGSTGRPKGVANTHRGWLNRMACTHEATGLEPGEAVLLKTALTFDDAPVECFWPLMTGGRVAVLPPGEHREPRAIVAAAARYRAAVILLVPSMLEAILESVDRDACARLTGLRHVGTSGEALRPELVRQFFDRFGTQGPTLHNNWGVTEASIDQATHVCTEDDTASWPTVPIGGPLSNTELFVLNGALRPVPVGVRGDLYVAGAGLARGYAGDPRRTAEVFLPHPWADGARLYRTGDQAYRRRDGEIVFVGRSDHQVKVRGVRVEPGEVEQVLLEHDSVAAAVVVPWEAKTGDKRLVAYIASHPDSGTATDDLWEHMDSRLPAYMVPALVVPLDEMPRTASGKVDRRRLPQPDASRLGQQEHVPPRTVTEEYIADVWTLALRTDIGVLDNFFQAGGHSLLGARIVSQIQDHFDIEIPLRVMFEKPTIAQLAAYIESEIASEIARMSDDEITSITARELES